MKRLLSLCLALLLVFSMSSCKIAKKVARKILEDEISVTTDVSNEKEDSEEDETKKTVPQKTTKSNEEEEDEESDKDEEREQKGYQRNYTYEDSISKMFLIQEDPLGNSRIVDLEGNIIEHYSPTFYQYIDNTSLVAKYTDGGDIYLYDMLTGEKTGPYEYMLDSDCYQAITQSDLSVYSKGEKYGLSKNGEKLTDATFDSVGFMLDGYVCCMDLFGNKYVILDEDGNQLVTTDGEVAINMGYGFFAAGNKPRIYFGEELLIDKTFTDAIALDENTIFAIDETKAYFFDREGNPLNGKYTTSNYHICDDIINSMGNIVLVNYDYNYGNRYTVLDKYGKLIGREYSTLRDEQELRNFDEYKVIAYQPNTFISTTYPKFESNDGNKYNNANIFFENYVKNFAQVQIDNNTGKAKNNVTGETKINQYDNVVSVELTHYTMPFFDVMFADGLGDGPMFSENFYLNTDSGYVYSIEDLFFDFYRDLIPIEDILRQELVNTYAMSNEEAKNYGMVVDSSFKIERYTGASFLYFKMAPTGESWPYEAALKVQVYIEDLAPYLDTSHELFTKIK